MWPNPEETADFVTFTKEIIDEKLHFLCSEITDQLNLYMKKLKFLI